MSIQFLWNIIFTILLFDKIVNGAVLGIDFGSDNFKVVLVQRKTMDIVFNDASNRKTETLIGFRNNERVIGSEALVAVLIKSEF